jgi:hypothetical protein
VAFIAGDCRSGGHDLIWFGTFVNGSIKLDPERLPALRLHCIGRFVADDEYAADTVRCCLVVDWTVAVSPVNDLASAVTGDGYKLVFMPCPTPTTHHLIDLRTNDVPNLTPNLARRTTERSWMTF